MTILSTELRAAGFISAGPCTLRQTSAKISLFPLFNTLFVPRNMHKYHIDDGRFNACTTDSRYRLTFMVNLIVTEIRFLLMRSSSRFFLWDLLQKWQCDQAIRCRRKEERMEVMPAAPTQMKAMMMRISLDRSAPENQVCLLHACPIHH
jgi:hypothetical protein